ncbi:MAG: hypothetical protein KDD90_04750 [Sphingomonadaceae bacterium]|nr:hypothetical protein [Sphingomonadaceae bacterium]
MNGTMPPESKRKWLSGLAITVTSLVALFGFWRIAPGTTYLIAVGALICLVCALWVAGKED